MGSKNNTTTTAPNPQAGAAYSGLLNRAATVASTPYQAYTGELVAPVNAQQNLGIGNINQGAGFAQPYIQQAADYANNAAQPLTAEDIARYSDPYTQQVINATEGQFAHDNAVQQQGVLGNAAAQGALGGNRVGVAQALTAEGQQRAQAPVIAGLRSQGYNTGLNTAMNQQQQQAQAAYSLGNLGVAGQNAYLTGANAQIGAGTLQQGTQQAADAARYGQFTQAQAFPYQQTQWQAGIDTGVGSQMGGTTTKPGPNLLTQLGGLGVAATGAFMGNPGMVAGGAGMMGGGGGSGGSPSGGGPPQTSSAQYWAPNPYQYGARGGRIQGFDAGGPVMPYGGSGMPYAGVGPSWMPQGQITHGRGMAGVAGGMEDAPSSPGVAKMMQDATLLARKFMQPGGQAFGGAVSPPSDNSIMIPRGYEDGGTPTMAGFGSGSMVPEDYNLFDPNPTPTYANGFPPEDRPPSQWDSGKLREVPFDPASFAPGTFGMATPEDQPPDPYIGGRDEAYRAAMAAAGDDPYGANEARAGVGGSSPEAPTAGVGNTGGWSSGIGPALMSAGFGMMASQSPFIGTAIGEGGLAGLKTYTEGQQREVANRRAEATMARQDAQTNIQQKGLDLRVNELKQRALQAQEALKAQTQRQQEALKAQKERQQEAIKAQQERHAEDIAMRERALREGKVPPGYRFKEDGTLERITGGPYDPDVLAENERAKHNATPLSEEARKIGAEQIIRGNIAEAVKGLGKGAQSDARIMEMRNEAAEILTKRYGYSPELAAEYLNEQGQKFRAAGIGKSAEARTIGAREGNLGIILRAADAAVPAALEASERVRRVGGNLVPLNKLIQKGEVMTSDADLKEFGMANLQLAEHWARAMNPTGVMRESDRDRALSFLDVGDSKETYRRAVMQLQKQIQREMTAVKAGKDSPMGDKPDPFKAEDGAPAGAWKPPANEAGWLQSKSTGKWKSPSGKIFNPDGSPSQ